jgi:hypothetical protein
MTAMVLSLMPILVNEQHFERNKKILIEAGRKRRFLIENKISQEPSSGGAAASSGVVAAGGAGGELVTASGIAASATTDNNQSSVSSSVTMTSQCMMFLFNDIVVIAKRHRRRRGANIKETLLFHYIAPIEALLVRGDVRDHPKMFALLRTDETFDVAHSFHLLEHRRQGALGQPFQFSLLNNETSRLSHDAKHGQRRVVGIEWALRRRRHRQRRRRRTLHHHRAKFALERRFEHRTRLWHLPGGRAARRSLHRGAAQLERGKWVWLVVVGSLGTHFPRRRSRRAILFQLLGDAQVAHRNLELHGAAAAHLGRRFALLRSSGWRYIDSGTQTLSRGNDFIE